MPPEGENLPSRMVAILDWGGFAEQVVCPDVMVYPVPDGVELHRAIYLPNSYGADFMILSRADSIRFESAA